MELLRTLFWSFGLVVFLLGIQGMLYFPLTIAYESWKRRALRRLAPSRERVSVVVPAYNEERTIRVAVETLLESEYPDLEVIVVDDGSQDGTADRLLDLHQQGRIRLIRQQNAGKAAALNAGIAAATGEVVLYTDADSLFLRETVAKTVRWFADPSVDAVCGNDVPLRARTGLQKLLAVTTHIGTGYVRRALSVIGCLPMNFVNMALVPALQAFLLLALPLALTRGWLPIDGPWEVASWLGLSFFFAVAIYAILLDRDPGDLLYLPWGALIVPVSYFYNAVALYSWWKEMRKAEEKWEKIRRLGPAPEVPRQWAFAASLLAVAIAASVTTWSWLMRTGSERPP